MTTALYLLRCAEAGIAMSDLTLLTVGMVIDIMTERANDSQDYETIATQDDFDSF